MTISATYLEMLRDLLAPVGDLRIKKMFGGASVYVDDVILALIANDTLYFKADTRTQKRYEAEGLGRFTYEGKTRPVSMSYWRVPERLFDEPDDLLEWAREALNVARACAKPKPTKIRVSHQARTKKVPRKAKAPRGAKSST